MAKRRFKATPGSVVVYATDSGGRDHFMRIGAGETFETEDEGLIEVLEGTGGVKEVKAAEPKPEGQAAEAKPEPKAEAKPAEPKPEPKAEAKATTKDGKDTKDADKPTSRNRS